MPSNGGKSKIGGEDKRKSLELHAQLEDERVHTTEELKTVLEPLEQSNFKRKTLELDNIEQYLRRKENRHWGNPQYEKTGPVDFHMDLQYSPWLKLEEDTLIQGRLTTKGETPNFSSPDLEAYVTSTIANSDHLESLEGDHEVCWISIPTNYDEPLDYMDDIDYVVDGIEMGTH